MLVKQIGPTCGIYALLNGIRDFYSLKEFTASKMHEIAYELLIKNQVEAGKTASDGKTFIGEFFDIDDYLLFVNQNKSFIEQQILKEFNKNIKIEVSKIPFSQISREKGALFISAILAGKIKNNGQTVLHWISFQSSDKKYKVMDSRSRLKRTFTLEQIRVKHFNLADCSFYWNLYKRKRYFFATNKNEKYVRCRLKKKYIFLENKVLHNKINYRVGEVLIIKKV